MNCIATTFFFESDSTPGKLYQTQQYTDGTTSCDCPGWTRRCVNGMRTCKHVRMVAAGLVQSAVKIITGTRPARPVAPFNRQPKRAAAAIDEATTRRLDLKED